MTKRRKRRRTWKTKDHYRDVYVMKRISGQSWYAILTFQGEYKIGISKSTKTRNKAIDKAIKGKVAVLSKRKMLKAYQIEQKLHRLFGDSRFRMSGGRAGGLTEWFYMNPAEYAFLELWLTYYDHKLKIDIAFIIILSSAPAWSKLIMDYLWK